MKISAGPAAVGAGCWARGGVVTDTCEYGGGDDCLHVLPIPSLLHGVADGVLGASNRVLYLARRFLRGTFGLRLCIAGRFADNLFHGAFHLMSCALHTILVHIRSPKLPSNQHQVWRLVAKNGGSFWIMMVNGIDDVPLHGTSSLARCSKF